MADDDSLIRKMLADAEGYVSRMPPTPGSRELRARLDKYRLAFEAWSTRAPTDEQREALRDQIAEVVRIARSGAPTVKLKPL